MKYKAFISYSHTHRLRLAAALEAALHRFGVPDHERAGLRFFRDTTNLSASPELWPEIEAALGEAEFLLLVASPEAAASPWVAKEVSHWREHRGAANMILVLADGEIAWDGAAGDFDFGKTTALPQTIRKIFSQEPLYVDLRAVNPWQYDLAYPAFCDPVATIAARLHGTPKDALFGIYAATRIAADAARLAAEADLALRDGFPERSLLLSAASLRLTDERGQPRVPAAEAILRAGLSQSGGRPLGPVLQGSNAIALRCTPEKRNQRIATAEEAFRARPTGYTAGDLEVPFASFSPNGNLLATIGPEGAVRIWSLGVDWRDRSPLVLESKAPVSRILFAGNSRWLIGASDAEDEAGGRGVFCLWDLMKDPPVMHKFDTAGAHAVMCRSSGEQGSCVAADLKESGVNVWRLPNPEEGDEPILLAQHAKATGAIAMVLVSGLRQMVTSGKDGRIRLWRIEETPQGDPDCAVIHEGEDGFARDLAVSPDGQWLVANPLIQDFTVASPPLLWRLEKETLGAGRIVLDVGGNRVWSMHFSPQSSWLLCIADTSFLVPLRNPDPGANLIALNATGGTIWNYCFSNEDLWLATATGFDALEELSLARDPEYDVRLWDNLRFKPWRLSGHEDVVTGVAIVPDGSRLISCSLDHSIRCWNCETVRKFQKLRIEARSNPGAENLDDAPGGLDEHENEHVARSFREPSTFLASDDKLLNCVVSPDGLWLLTVSFGEAKAARLWLMIGDPLAAAPLRLPKLMMPTGLAIFDQTQKWFFYGELARAAGCKAQFSAKSRYLFISQADDEILLFDTAQEGNTFSKLIAGCSAIRWAGFSPDEQWLAATSTTEEHGLVEIRLWNPARSNGLDEGVAAKLEKTPWSVEFSSDSRWLLAVHAEGAYLWDLRKDDPLRHPITLPGMAGAPDSWGRERQVEFSPDGHWLINGAHPDGIAIHDLRGAEAPAVTAMLPVQDTVVSTVAVQGGGTLLLAGGTNGFARLWQLSPSGEPSRFMDLSSHERLAKGVFSSDQRWLVTADFNAIQLWDLVKRECRCSIQKREGDLQMGFGIVFLAQDRWVVVSKSHAIFLIDLGTAESAARAIELPGHQFERVGFWFTPDHRWLVTSDFPLEAPRGRGRTPTVRIWDLTSSRPAGSSISLPDLEAGVRRINISPDGRWLTTTTEDGVRAWPLGTPHLIELAKKVAGREFSDEERERYQLNELA